MVARISFKNPYIAVNIYDELLALSIELFCSDRETKRERMGHLAAVTPDSRLFQRLYLKTKHLEKLGTWTWYLHLGLRICWETCTFRTKQLHSSQGTIFRSQHYVGFCPPEPQGRAQTRRDRHRDYTRGSTSFFGSDMGISVAREASHSVFGSKSGLLWDTDVPYPC